MGYVLWKLWDRDAAGDDLAPAGAATHRANCGR